MDTNSAYNSQEYWEKSYDNYRLDREVPKDCVHEWIEKVVQGIARGDCIELGAYPGRYLRFLGQLGFTVSGVDAAAKIETDLPKVFGGEGLSLGTFVRADVLEYKPRQHYDLVCSFGFIEHFEQLSEILVRHAGYLKDEGHLLITVPNFRGLVQRTLRYWLDYKNFSQHNLRAMDLPYLQDTLQRLGFEIRVAEFFGNFDFWTETAARNLPQRLALRSVMAATPKFSGLPNCAMWSPHLGILAAKKPTG